MKDLIENYQTHINQLESLHKKLILLHEYITKVTANYGHNTNGSKGLVSSKVERHVIKIKETEEKIMALENKIYIVNKAERVLNNKEKEVIEMIKIHRNKLTRIAKILGKDKDYVKHKRDTAIKKMEDYAKNV